MSDAPAAGEALLRLDCLDRALKLQFDDAAAVIAAAQSFYNFVVGNADAPSTVTVDPDGNITGFSPGAQRSFAQGAQEGARP